MKRSQSVHSTQPTELQSMLKKDQPSPAASALPQMKETPAGADHIEQLRRPMIIFAWDLVLLITPLVFIGEL